MPEQRSLRTWRFSVPGRPVPKERPRRSPRGHWYTPRRTKEYEELVAWCAIEAGFEAKAPYYDLKVTIPEATRGDRDNILKSICDGLNKVPGFDDRQIVTVVVDVSESADTVVEIRERW